jgi:uncharacterized protein
MKTRENRIPPLLELTIVLGITYGLMVFPALWHAMGSRTLSPLIVSDGRMGFLVLFELFTGGLGLLVLWLNGWHRADLGLACSFRDCGMGVLMFLAVMFFHYLTFSTIRWLAPDSPLLQGRGVSGHVSFPMLILVCVINPLFEEGILLGYVMKVLRPQGFGVACGISLLLRLSTHLYQGPFAVVSILPVGLIFSAYFWRTNKIWAVVFAHMFLDLLPLLQRL